MSKRRISPQVFLERARPSLPALYQTALLITDSAELSEAALARALFEEYSTETRPRDKRALRESLRKTTRDCALASLRSAPLCDAERGDWRGATGESVVDDAALSALFGRFSMEEVATQRYILLRYGCGVSAQWAAEAAELTAAQAKERVERFRSRAAGANAEAFDRALTRMCRLVVTESAGSPDMSAVCRAFERDAVESLRGTRRRRNVPGYVLCAIGILLCAALFWLIAVLLEPSNLNMPADTVGALGEKCAFLRQKIL